MLNINYYFLSERNISPVITETASQRGLLTTSKKDCTRNSNFQKEYGPGSFLGIGMIIGLSVSAVRKRQYQ